MAAFDCPDIDWHDAEEPAEAPGADSQPPAADCASPPAAEAAGPPSAAECAPQQPQAQPLGLSLPPVFAERNASKFVRRGGSGRLRFAAVSMPGRRSSMEDAEVMRIWPDGRRALTAVFDGHAGAAAAHYLQTHFAAVFEQLEQPQTAAIEREFIALDRRLLAALGDRIDGSTCTACFVQAAADGSDDWHACVMNVGDSRTLLLPAGGGFELLTSDHKPSVAEERQRIVAAGGFVSETARVDGALSVSRAFGDRPFKCNAALPAEQQKVCALPDARSLRLRPGDRLLLACDGLFEAWECDEAVARLRQLLQRFSHDPAAALMRLLDDNERSDDNTTAIVLELVDGSQYGPAEEFIPGPITDDEQKAWMYAYYEFARLHGFDREQTDRLRCQRLEREIAAAARQSHLSPWR